MAKNTKTQGRAYPKPFDGFPLSAHPQTNRWYKKIKGVRHYFGGLDDWQAALERYNHEAPYRVRGEQPPPMGQAADTRAGVKAVVSAFMDAKARAVEAGEMTPRSLAEYHAIAKVIGKTFGHDRNIESLTPEDFGRLRLALGKTRKSPTTLGNAITRARSIFKFAVDNGITDKATRYGTQFSKPKRRAVKLARREKAHQFFEPHEIHALLAVADAPMAAAILLAANCGLGNDDLNNIATADLDLEAGMLDLYRRKTGEERRAALWAETVEAVRKAILERPTPTDEAHADRVFITSHGREWVRTAIREVTAANSATDLKMSRSDNFGQRFNKLRIKAGIDGKGRGFYAIRHTFRTVADAVPDRPAVDLTMGHENSADIRTAYVDPRSISVDRLRAVADHVYKWLWPEK